MPIKKKILLGLVLFLLFSKNINCQTHQLKKPNIILIVADDLGWNDVSFNGSEIFTPSIDSLKLQGISLKRFYVSPKCSPTRAGLLTGIYPDRFNLRGYVYSTRYKGGVPTELIILPEMLKKAGNDFEGKNVVISGSGNVAQYAAEKVMQLGGKVISLSDSSGTIHDKDGLTQEKLEWVMDLKNNKRGRVKEYSSEFKVDYLDGKNPWSIPCQIALPCATQNEISLEDAKSLVNNGCKVISEGANMPSDPEAINMFLGNDILFGPGKAANAGGVATSGLEMSQNSMRINWTRKEVDEKLHQIMKDIHDSCVEHGIDNGSINYVKGANIAGFIKVADAMLDQGVV